MKKNILLVFFLCVNISVSVFAQNPFRIDTESGGFARKYLVYLPRNYSAENPADLMVCLHGFNRTMDDFFSNYNIAQLADSLHVIVLAPQALPEKDPRVINAANNLAALGIDIPLDAAWGCGLRVVASLLGIPILNEELNKPVNDAAFINEIIQTTLKNYHIRGKNQFLFGTSMGGFMSYQYALNYGNELAGIISVCGSMGTSIQNTEAEVRLPICDFHSETDEVVPYTGEYIQSGVTVSLCWKKEDVLNFWVNKNNANPTPLVENVQYYPSSNSITVQKMTFQDSDNEVVHYKTKGASHSYYFRKENGDCMDYNEEVFKFIAAHRTVYTGVQSPDKSPVLVSFYPNPVKEALTINAGADRVMSLIVTDIQGRIIDRINNLNSNLVTISATRWSKGLHFVRVQTNHGCSVQKVAKE